MIEILPSFAGFLLVLVRVTSFFLMMPLFSYRSIPTQMKIGLGFFLAIVMMNTIEMPVFEINGEYFLLVLKEALVGIITGFLAYMIMAAIQIAGGFIDFQIGFAIANVVDPQSGTQSPLFGQFLYTFAMLLLVTTNGHHIMLDGIYHSYSFIPIDQYFLPLGNENFAEFIILALSKMFAVAFQLAIPVVGCIFLVDVALGIVARTVPQINIFVVGLPVKIVVAFLLLTVVISMMFVVMTDLFELMFIVMKGIMQLLGGA